MAATPFRKKCPGAKSDHLSRQFNQSNQEIPMNMFASSPILSSSTISGDKVVNRQGEDLGDNKDLMIDVENGRVAFAVLEFGGFLGLGRKLFAVHLSAMEIDTGNH